MSVIKIALSEERWSAVLEAIDSEWKRRHEAKQWTQSHEWLAEARGEIQYTLNMYRYSKKRREEAT
jgi:hypothetical protein